MSVPGVGLVVKRGQQGTWAAEGRGQRTCRLLGVPPLLGADTQPMEVAISLMVQ